MKFLICGIGSIGQRHYKNLISLGQEVALFREGGGANSEFINKFFAEEKSKGREIIVFKNFEEAIAQYKPNAVFITNPNSKHLETALKAARLGQNMFIEKPVANELNDEVKVLQQLAEEKKLNILIGYNLRWHPLLIKMKKMLADGVIGKPLCANIEMGECMIDWHPWEDYTKTYAPYKSGGGGAVLCFSHDIDYMYWFFGMPEKVFTAGGKITPLQGDAEDMVKSILTFKNNFIVSLHLDYWQRPSKRIFEIVGTEGKLIWHYEAKSLTHIKREKNAEPIVYLVDEKFDRNDMFIEEIKNFVGSLTHQNQSAIPLQQGIDVLQICEMIKQGVE